jgi:hypothetical protein
VLGVEERAVRAGADLVDDVGLEIGVDGTRDVLALAWGELALGVVEEVVPSDVPVSEKKVLKPVR